MITSTFKTRFVDFLHDDWRCCEVDGFLENVREIVLKNPLRSHKCCVVGLTEEVVNCSVFEYDLRCHFIFVVLGHCRRKRLRILWFRLGDMYSWVCCLCTNWLGNNEGEVASATTRFTSFCCALCVLQIVWPDFSLFSRTPMESFFEWVQWWTWWWDCGRKSWHSISQEWLMLKAREEKRLFKCSLTGKINQSEYHTCASKSS